MVSNALSFNTLETHRYKKLTKTTSTVKGLVLVPKKYEIEKLLTGLSPKGLHMIINDAESEDEARAIIERVADLSK